MADTAIAAAYRAIHSKLTQQSEPWGTSVFSDVIPASAEFPVVQFFWSGGGEANNVRRQDAEIVVTVKAVSDESQAEAFTLAGRISALLNDKGEQDVTTGYLEAGSTWNIVTVTEQDAVHIVDMYAGVKPIYHAGARYRLVMETT